MITQKWSITLLLLIVFGFTHAQNAITVPYFTGFENEQELSDWEATYALNNWIIGSDVAYSGTSSLYISSDYDSYYYDPDYNSVSHYYAKVVVPQNGMYIDFDYRVGGVPDQDEFFVSILSEEPEVEEMAPSYLEKYCCTPTEWNHARLFVSPTYAGEKYLVFSWKNDNGGGTQPPAAIDNLSLSLVECTIPANFTAVNVESRSADLSWDAVNGAAEYIILSSTAPYSDWDTIAIPAATTYSLTGLTSQAEYKVKIAAVCSVADTSAFSEPIPFTTPASCLPPHTPGIVELTDTTALINWNNTAERVFEYEIRYAGRDMNWTTVHTSDTFYFIESLSPGDYYTVIIFQDCSDGDYSASIEISFYTPCLNRIQPLPFEERFEDTVFPPLCWGYEKLSGSSDMMQWSDTTIGYNGNGTVFRSYKLPDGSSSLLITPPVDLTSPKPKVLSFYMYRDGERIEKTEEGITVWFNETPDTIGAVELIHIPRVYYYMPDEDDEGWYQYDFTLPESVSTSGYVLFQGIGQDGNDVYLDEVKIGAFAYIEKEIHDTICYGTTYDFNGEILEASGIYRDTLFTTTAADTIMILNLTVNLKIEFTIYDTICAGASYSFADTSYTDHGTYSHTFTEGLECDSTVILHLAVNSIPEAPVITMETIENEIWLISSEGEGIKWYKDGTALDETELRIRVSDLASYHATFSNDCGESASSNTIVVESNKINDYELSQFLVYPNPASSFVKITGETKMIEEVGLYTMDGKIVWQKPVNDYQAEINTSSLPEGLYIVRVLSENHYSYIKLQVIR